jgi:hypothetical protein
MSKRAASMLLALTALSGLIAPLACSRFEPGGTPDGGAEAASGEVEAGSSDGGVLVEAATPDAAAAVPFCKRAPHKLCLDFENNSYGEGVPELTDGGAVMLSTGNAFESVVCLRTTIDDGEDTRNARLAFPALTLGSPIVLELRAKIEDRGAAGNRAFLFTLQDAPSNYRVRVGVDTSGMLGVSLKSEQEDLDKDLEAVPPGWFHVRVFVLPGQHVSVAINGGQKHDVAFLGQPPASLILKAGAHGTSPLAVTLHLDDIALD